MRYLGVDYGLRRIGLATADEETKIAVPLRTLVRDSDAGALVELRALVQNEKIGQVVIGMPLGMDGNSTEMSGVVRAFVVKLQAATEVPVEYENEILTTRMVTHEGVRAQDVDAASAAIILQSYLDKRRP